MKKLLLAAMTALAMTPSAAVATPVDMFPVGLGKKKQVSRKRRMRNMTVELTHHPKREHKHRHKKGKP